MGAIDKIKSLFPTLDELAEVMCPTNAGEAFAPITGFSKPWVDDLKMERTSELARPLHVTDEKHFEIIAQEQEFDISEVSVSGKEVDIKIDFVNKIFADVMRVMSNVGILVILVSSVFYFVGVNPNDNLTLEVQRWTEPASQFWRDVKGTTAEGYWWFLSNPLDPENGILISVVFLALTPLVGFIFAIPRTSGVFRILLLVITAEFIYAIVRAVLFGVGAE